MSNDRQSKTLQADVHRFPAEISTALSKMWTGLKMRLFSCKLAATNFGIILSPHSKREMKYSICQSWSGCIRKKTSPNLLLLVVEDWALVSRVLLQQRVTELLFHPNSSVSTTCLQKFQCSCGGAQTIGQAFCFEETVDEKLEFEAWPNCRNFSDLANELQK